MRYIRRMLLVGAVSLGFGIVGCYENPPPAKPLVQAAADESQEEPRLDPVEVGDTDPAHRFGSYYLAAQPTADDLAEWKELGVRTVINLRMPNEINWDERAAVEELGMRYVSIPFAAPETLTDEVIAQSLRAMADEKHHPLLLHCSTSNRTGAIWYAHRMVNDGVDRQTALEEAKQVGLRTMAHIKRIDRYIESQREGRGH